MSVTLCCCMRLKTFGVLTGGLGVILNLPMIGVLLAQIFDDELDEEIKITYLDLFCYVYILVRAIYCFTSIMLVVGSVKERHRLVLPWLINSGVILAIDPLFFLICLKHVLPYIFFVPDINLFFIYIGIAFYVFQWYMHNGIHSLYKEIKASTKIKRPLLQPETPDTIIEPDFFRTNLGPFKCVINPNLASESN